MSITSTLRLLSHAQREHLLKHIDGREVPVLRHGIDACFVLCLKKLLSLKLIEQHPKNMPRYSTATQAGRALIAAILATYADALVQAGFLEPDPAGESPLQVLTRLKEAARARKAGQRPLSPAAPADLASQLAGIAGKLPV